VKKVMKNLNFKSLLCVMMKGVRSSLYENGRAHSRFPCLTMNFIFRNRVFVIGHFRVFVAMVNRYADFFSVFL
jgi:hypothetical protein